MDKLWIISELFPPDETSTAYILGEVANAMSEKYAVKVICGPEIYDKRKKIDPNNQFHLRETIEVYRVSTLDVDKNTVKGKIESVVSSSLGISKEVKKRVKAGDKVLLVTNPFPLIILMARLKKKIGFELNLLVHDVFPENTKPANVHVPCMPVVKKLFAWAYSKADLFIALGRDMRDVISEKVKEYNREPHIEIIENWADIVNIKPTDRTSDDCITIEYAGNIGRGQGLKGFIDNLIVANNNLLRFDLYGTGAVEDSLKKEVNARSFMHVAFHGPYYRSQQYEVLNNCDIALVTLAEGAYGIGVPSKSYNIMAAGKPILYIGHPKSEIALLIKEKETGYVFAPEDNAGIQTFLANLTLDDLKKFKEMGARARKVAEDEYSKDIILDKFKKAI